MAMDSTIFQLYSLGEILERLGQTLQTGCLHVFTSRESANIFFKDGILVAAVRGLSEGEEVIRQILEWKDPRMIWQPNETAPTSFKSLTVNIADHLQPKKQEEAENKNSKARREPTPKPRPVVYIAPPAEASPQPKVVAQPASLELKPVDAATSSAPTLDLTATKTIGSTAQARTAQEEALIQKHKLVLIHSENSQHQIKITRANSLIGRNPACDITVNHASVSRQHCLLHLTDRGLHVKDLDTTNGTKVNGIVLTEGYVSVGDKLAIGHEVFILKKE